MKTSVRTKDLADDAVQLAKLDLGTNACLVSDGSGAILVKVDGMDAAGAAIANGLLKRTATGVSLRISATNSGLQAASDGLALKLSTLNPSLGFDGSGALHVLSADASLNQSSGGLSVNIGPAGGLSVPSLPAGLGIKLDGTSLATSSNGALVNLATNSGLQISSGLLLKLTDTSLVLGAGGVGVNLASNSGLHISSGLLLQLADNSLQLAAGGASVKLADTSLATNGSGVAVALATNSGLQVSSGLLLQLADTSLQLAAGGASVKLASSSGLHISSGLLLQLADNSLQLAAGGASVKLADTSLATAAGGVAVALATNSGLHVSSGLLLQLADSSLQLAAGGASVKLATNGGLAVSGGLVHTGFRLIAGDAGSPAQGDTWFNTTSQLPRLAETTSFNTTLAQILFAGAGSSISNTNAVTAFTPNSSIPASFFNVLGRTLRMKSYLNANTTASPTFTLSLRYNNVVLWTTTLATAAINDAMIDLVCSTITTGASGVIFVQGFVTSVGGTLAAVNAANTVDLTVTGTFGLYGQWSAASVSNSATAQYLIAELLN